MAKVATENEKKKSYFCLKDERYPVSNQSLADIFEEAANREDQNYVTWYRPAERYTYRELYQRAQNVAKGLIAAGLTRGDCVMGVGCQGSDGVVMFMATASVGLIFTCPYIPSPSHKTMAAALLRVKPSLVLSGNARAGALLEDSFMTLNDLLKNMSDEGNTLPSVYHDSISAQSDDCMKCNLFAKPLTSLIEEGATVSDEQLREEILKTRTNEPCYYTQTSGTTGEPKVVVIGANYFTNMVSCLVDRLLFKKEETVCGIPNIMTEDVTLMLHIIGGAKIGHALVVFPQPAPVDEEECIREICECIQQHRVSFASIDQYYTRLIALNPHIRNQYDLTSVKGWVLCAAPVGESSKKKMLEDYPGTVDIYGMSECLGITCPVFGVNRLKPNSIGRPLVNVQVKVCNEEGNIVNCGVRGELFVKSHGMFLSYKDQPELTKGMLTEDGFLKTGDCLWMDEDGDLFYVSRMSKSERFKVLGDVVYAAPMENILKTHPKIKDCSVIGTLPPVDFEGHEICFCIVPHVAGSMTRDEVRDFSVKEMSCEREWPRRVIFMNNLPRHGIRKKVSKLKLIENLEKEIEACKSIYEVEYDFKDMQL